MRRVMAQGTFDVLHPGHLHYLRESAGHGDELLVIVGRDEKLMERKDLLFDERTRVSLLDALAVVDRARLGAEGDIYDIFEVVDPDVVTLGFDQPYDEAEIERGCEAHGYADVAIERIDRYDRDGAEIVSSSTIKEHIRAVHGPAPFHSVVDS